MMEIKEFQKILDSIKYQGDYLTVKQAERLKISIDNYTKCE